MFIHLLLLKRLSPGNLRARTCQLARPSWRPPLERRSRRTEANLSRLESIGNGMTSFGVKFNILRQKGRCWGFCQAIGKLSVLHCQAVFKLWFSNWHSRNQHNCHISGEQQQQEGVCGEVWLCWVERGLPRYRPGSVDLRESPKVWPDVPKSAIWPSVLVNTVQIKTFCETRNI